MRLSHEKKLMLAILGLILLGLGAGLIVKYAQEKKDPSTSSKQGEQIGGSIMVVVGFVLFVFAFWQMTKDN